MEEVKVVELDTAPAQSSIKELRAELKKYRDEMAGLEEGSDAFLEVANKAGQVKHQIDAITESVRGASADFGDMVGNATRLAAGIAGGFQAAQGALTLFGVESEEVTKAIQKMQASMAVIQGLSSIDQGIKSLDKLRNAIVATTGPAKVLKTVLTPKSILALTVAITAIITVWNRFGDSIEQALPFIQKIKDAFKDTADEAERAKKTQEEYLENVKSAKDKLDEFNRSQQVSKLNSESKKSYDELSNSIKGYSLEIDYIVEQQKKDGISKEEWNELQSRGLELDRLRTDAIKQQNAILNDNTSYVEKNTQASKENHQVKEEIKDTFFEDAYAEIEYNKAINTEYANSKEALEDLLNIQQMQLSALEEGSAAWYNLGVNIENTKNKIKEFGQDTQSTEESGGLSAEDTELQNLLIKYSLIETSYKEHLNNMQSKLDDAHERGLISEETYVNGCNKLQKQKADYQIKSSISALNGVASILNSFASMEDQNNEKGFERSKKLQIASATIQMITGIATAISGAFTFKSGPWDIALAAIQAGVIAASAGAQIAQIKKQKYNSSSAGSSVPSVSSGAVSSTVMPPAVYSQALQGASTEQTISNARSYVSVTEINEVGNRVEVEEGENRY